MEEKKPISLSQTIIVSLLVTTSVFILRYSKLPPQIPLFYSRPEGEEAIADLLFVFIIPTISLIMVVVNQLLLRKYYRHNKFIKHVVYYANMAIIIVSLLLFLKIILLIS